MTSPETLAGRTPQAQDIQAVLEKRWARWLIPSLSDLFFVAMMVWLFVGGEFGWQGLLTDADVGWHIRTGEYILDHHTVPYQDLYSFSKAGAPWYAWEWLTDILDAGLHRMAGLKGVVLFAGVMIAIFCTTLIRRMVWRGTHLMVALLISLLAVGASTIHFLARPHLFTLLFLSISMWMIEADRDRPTRRIWWLVPLTVVWTNLHGGFLSLIAVLGLAAVGSAVEAWLGAGRTIRDAVRYAKLTIACGLASLVNPYGWNLHKHVVEYLQSDWIRQVVQEFQSPRFRDENMMQFEVLLVVGLLAAASLLRHRKVAEALWIVFWLHMALGSVRHVPVFATIAAPLIASQVSLWWNQFSASASKNSLPGILNAVSADSIAGFRRTSILPAALVVALILIGAPIKWPTDFPALKFPTEMVHANRELLLKSRVLTTDQWADYLIYTDPSQKVFVDGRSDFYGPEVGNEFLDVTAGRPNWNEVMNKYQFNVVLLPLNTALVQLLRQRPEWEERKRDDQNILLVKRSAAALEAAKTLMPAASAVVGN